MNEIQNPSFAKPPLVAWFSTKKNELVTPDEVATLKELEAEFLTLEKQRSQCDNFAVRRTIEATRAAYQNDPTPQAFARLQKMTESREELRLKNRELARQIKVALETFATRKVFPIVAPILKRASVLVGEFAVTVRNQEQAVADQVGVVHVASNALQAIDSFQRNLRVKADALGAREFRGESSPRSFLRGILEL